MPIWISLPGLYADTADHFSDEWLAARTGRRSMALQDQLDASAKRNL